MVARARPFIKPFRRSKKTICGEDETACMRYQNYSTISDSYVRLILFLGLINRIAACLRLSEGFNYGEANILSDTDEDQDLQNKR